MSIKDQLQADLKTAMVAPQRVEQRFTDVPGIRRTFLAGDHRDHNVLLVAPNREDPVLTSRSDEEVRQYLGQMVASVNAELAPYERVVNFALVDRDFSLEEGELTPKGTLRRKVIEEHFRTVIDDLYRGTHVELPVDGLRVRIPRWFFRDLAGLEDDIVAEAGGVLNTRSGRRLTIARGSDGWIRVGDLQYQRPESVVDPGLFSRQPRLWAGNPSLVAFSPCKPGWDVPLRGLSASFDGKHNPGLYIAEQIAPVEPEKKYKVIGYIKTEN